MMKTTENNAGRNLQSIISIYQQDRRRFFQQKLQLESYIQKELGLSDDWIVELSGNFLKFTAKNISQSEAFEICDSFEDIPATICNETYDVSPNDGTLSLEITLELKRMEDDDGEY